MPGYAVECLNYDGKWSPKDGRHLLQSLLSASLETFAARLEGKRSRIKIWPSGRIVAEVPPLSAYVSPRDFYSQLSAMRKLYALGDFHGGLSNS